MTQAPSPVFSKPRDLDEARRALEPWLAERLGTVAVAVDGFTHPTGAGMSNETILFHASWAGAERDLVLRIHPRPQFQMFLETQFRAQFDLLSQLHRSGQVRVPEVLWFEADPILLGGPFFVMERLVGHVPVSVPVYNAAGFLKEATPEQRRIAWLSAMSQFCSIHNLPLAQLQAFDRPQYGSDGLDQELGYWRRCTDWIFGGRTPDVVQELQAWLAAHAPAERPPGMSWGDARMGNMIFGPDFEVLGVFDWEQASLGGPLQDLGWWTLFDEFHSAGHGLARLDGLGTPSETLELWSEQTGRTVRDLDWYQAFAGYKVTVLALRGTAIHAQPDPSPSALLPFVRSCEVAGIAVPASFR